MQELTQSPRRILTIDDNDAIHADFRKVLLAASTSSKLAGAKAALFDDEPAPAAEAPDVLTFEVDSALQGEEGLGKVDRAVQDGRPYSVAFVDMRMPPGWDGVQTIQRLWDVDPDLQVVICTAYSDYSWEDIAHKLGLTDRLLILKKPFDPAEVRQLAAALSEKWSLRRAAKLKLDELERMVRQRTHELEHAAQHDRLTGLPNRALLNERVTRAVARNREDPTYRYAVLFLDFDRFKMINDSLGHETGDRLLKGIAERLNAALQLAGAAAGDALAARLGGDEFVIFIDGISGVNDAKEFADGTLRLLSAPYRLDERDVHSTASIGITTSELRYERADEAIRDADTAMYHAKATGKARYVLFDRNMHEAVKARMEIENDLRGAVERGELLLHYQPIVSLNSRRIAGFEALVRWKHPRRGLVAPLQFVPICEEIGMIVPAGNWILGEACRQLRAWTDAHPRLADLTVSVNMSVKQLEAPDLITEIRGALERAGIEPRRLTLEITESVVIRDPDSAIRVLEQLRDLGVQLHMDDFGTGYSSLSCLHRFPFDGLKIDRSFVHNVGARRDYAAVVQAIVHLAHNLGISLIAEGVETDDQVAMLQAMDCDLAQGYLFGRPCDARGVEALCASVSVPAREAAVSA